MKELKPTVSKILGNIKDYSVKIYQASERMLVSGAKKVMRSLRNYSGKIYKDPARMLITTSALGWVLSSLAQISAIGMNNKLSLKEKCFLIPQEAFDGLVNVGLFFTLSMFAKKLTGAAIERNIISIRDHDQYKAPILTIVSIITGAIASNIITPYVRNYLGAGAQKSLVTNTVNSYEKTPKTIKPLLINDGTKPINTKFIYPTTMQTSLKI